MVISDQPDESVGHGGGAVLVHECPGREPIQGERGFIVPGSLLERMPMRTRGANLIAPPLFHVR